MIRILSAALVAVTVLAFAAPAAEAKRRTVKATPAEITAAFYADPSGVWAAAGYPAWAVFAFRASGGNGTGNE